MWEQILVAVGGQSLLPSAMVVVRAAHSTAQITDSGPAGPAGGGTRSHGGRKRWTLPVLPGPLLGFSYAGRDWGRSVHIDVATRLATI